MRSSLGVTIIRNRVFITTLCSLRFCVFSYPVYIVCTYLVTTAADRRVKRRRKNTTLHCNRIINDLIIIQPKICWSLYFITIFCDDVLCMRETARCRRNFSATRFFVVLSLWPSHTCPTRNSEIRVNVMVK